MRKKTMTLWLSPEEGERSPRGEEAIAFAASCAGTSIPAIRSRMEREGVHTLRVRVCYGLFFLRLVPTPEA